MHFIQQLFYLFFIFISKTTSTPIGDFSQKELCNWPEINCTLHHNNSFRWKSFLSTTTTEYSSTSENIRSNPYNINFKVAGILAVSVGLILVVTRICLMYHKSTSLSNRRVNTIQPQIATIGSNPFFTPDLPPAYSEAIANIDIDESKLPSYDELHNEQHARDVNRI